MNTIYDVLLDATEHDCPMPTIHAKNTLDSMLTGQVLKLLTSREGTIKNIRTLVANNSYELINEFREDEVIIFLIKKL